MYISVGSGGGGGVSVHLISTNFLVILLLYMSRPFRKIWVSLSNVVTFFKIQDFVQNGHRFY